jgi:hypothetical protein
MKLIHMLKDSNKCCQSKGPGATSLSSTKARAPQAIDSAEKQATVLKDDCGACKLQLGLWFESQSLIALHKPQ